MAATTTEGKIREALLAKLKALTFSPALPVAWPDVPFNRPAKGAYLSPDLFELPTGAVSISKSGSNRHTGLMQVTICAKVGTGVIAVADIAGGICAHFARETRMENGGLVVEVTKPPEVANTYRDDDITRTPVTIRYEVFARP